MTEIQVLKTEDANKRPDYVSGCILTFLGIVFTAGGVLLMWSLISFLPGTVPATGMIVSCVRIRTSCDPTVSFSLLSGQELTFQSAYASGSFQVGGTVPVRYYPKTPQDARIVSLEIWVFQLIFVGTGLFLLLVGLFHSLRRKSENLDQPTKLE